MAEHLHSTRTTGTLILTFCQRIHKGKSENKCTLDGKFGLDEFNLTVESIVVLKLWIQSLIFVKILAILPMHIYVLGQKYRIKLNLEQPGTIRLGTLNDYMKW